MMASILEGIIASLIAGALLLIALSIWKKHVLIRVRLLVLKRFGVGLINTACRYDKANDIIVERGARVSTIRAMGIQILNLISSKETRDTILNRILEANKNPGLSIRILVLDPDSKHVKTRAKEVGHKSSQELKKDILHTLSQLKVTKGYHQNIQLQIRLYDENPIWSLLFLDSTLFMGFYVDGLRRIDGECFICDSGKHSPYSAFEKLFENIWNHKSIEYKV